MKSVLISIRPEWVAKILNGIKSIEVRSSAPKDWKDYLSGKTKIEPKPRTAFIYCTDDRKEFLASGTFQFFTLNKKDPTAGYYIPYFNGNGKVVAKFTLKKIDCLRFGWERNPYFSGIGSATCLSVEDTKRYLNGKTGYLWHISDLEIFDEPKSLEKFGLKRAPQSYCYVEVEE